MAALPYMQLFVADYLADTAHLNAAQHGAYLLLIMNYWQRGKPLKNCDERLTNVARMSNEEWKANKNVIAEFFQITDEEWVHKRIEADLRAVESKSNKAKASRQVAINNRESKPSRTNDTTNVERTFNHTDTDTDTDTERKKESDAYASQKKTGSRFALTELPEEWRVFCHEKRPDLDADEVFVEFKDFWVGVPGQRGRKLDWFATWRNRVRDRKKSAGTPIFQSFAEQAVQKTDEALERVRKKYANAS